MILRKIFISFFVFLITSVSAFADGGYTNTLMGLDFAPADNNSVNMVVMTKTPYEGTLSVTRRDASTYILTLPNLDSSAPNPDLSKTYQISKVSIRTMPPSNLGNGYTRITIKTASPIELTAKNTIFQQDKEDVVRRNEYTPNRQNYDESYRGSSSRRRNNSARRNYNSQNNRHNYDRNINKSARPKRNNAERTNLKKVKVNLTEESSASNPIQTQPTKTDYENKYSNEDPTEQILLILGSILVVAASIFFFIKAKNKMVDIAGERLDIDLEEDNSSKTKKQVSKFKKNQSVRKAIDDLDEKYSNPKSMPKISHYSEPAPVMSAEKSTDDMDIVDLDALFNEQKNQTPSEENDALEDFLSEYSFDDDNKPEKEIADELYKVDEEQYKKLMNNKKLKFSKEDINCINQILNSEINNDVMNNIDKYLTSNPINNKPAKKSLDELITTYTISQNISFNNNDIKTLEKLMNVELDQDFVTDLRTDPERTKAMEKQILDFQNSELKKPSEIVTLKVSDLLPNLSDVLANPSKYEEKETPKYKPDESLLLKNIENVSFKPFDDGSRKFEILNDFSDEPQAVVELYSDDFIAKKKSAANIEKPKDKPMPIKQPTVNNNKNNVITPKISPSNKTVTTKENLKCIMDGKSYNVISSAAFTKNIGCHLAKADDGYFVLSYSGSNIALLKKLPEIKTEKIQARLSDKLSDGTYRFIIRIGNVKFVADLKNNCINFVMDL